LPYGGINCSYFNPFLFCPCVVCKEHFSFSSLL
jgi:hypothetical protein